SLSLMEAVFLNVRGLVVPAPIPEAGFGLTLAALAVAVVASIAFALYARRLQERTGRALPVYWCCTAMIIGLPLLAFVISGAPLSWEIPELKGFNFRGGITVIPELMALWLALSIYTASFIAEIVRSGIQSVPSGQVEAS